MGRGLVDSTNYGDKDQKYDKKLRTWEPVLKKELEILTDWIY